MSTHVILDLISIALSIWIFIVIWTKYYRLKYKKKNGNTHPNLFYFILTFIIVGGVVNSFHTFGSFIFPREVLKVFNPITYIYERGMFTVFIFAIWKFGVSESKQHINNWITTGIMIVTIMVGIYIGMVYNLSYAYEIIRAQAILALLITTVVFIDMLFYQDLYTKHLKTAIHFNFYICAIFVFLQKELGKDNILYTTETLMSHIMKIYSYIYLLRFSTFIARIKNEHTK